MKKHTELFLGNYIYAVFAGITLLVGGILWSKIKTENWLTIFYQYPEQVLLVVCIGLFFWFLLILFIRRAQSNRATKVRFVATPPQFGYTELSEYEHKDVFWPVRVPANPLSRNLSGQSITNPSDVTIGIPPRCPKCKTELDERKTFWRGYKWICPDCGFSKHNKNDFHSERDRVEKIVRRDYREELKQKDEDV